MPEKKKAQGIKMPVFQTEGEKLDLGCGHNKLKGAIGVDYFQSDCTDLVWDLEKQLPKKFWNRFGLVYSASVLDHMGNPLQFLRNCALYAKPDGFVQVIADNADYWRYHKKGKPFGNYHASLWFKESQELEVQHKMMFQPGHVETMFKMLGLEIVEKKLFWRQSIDYLRPSHKGNAYFSIVGKKAK